MAADASQAVKELLTGLKEGHTVSGHAALEEAAWKEVLAQEFEKDYFVPWMHLAQGLVRIEGREAENPRNEGVEQME